MPKKIHESTAITIPEVRELLLARAKEGELSYMQRIALEHAQLVTRIDAKDAADLVVTLKEKFQISHNGAISLANYMPDNIHEIRAILGKEAINTETSNLEEILNTLMSVKRIDKKAKSFTEVLDISDDDDDDIDQAEKEIDESMVPDDLKA